MSHFVYRDWPQSFRVAAVLVSIATVCGLLYWGQLVFIPLALAGLLTFLLSPLVARLERWRLGRVPAVVMVVAATVLVLGLVGWVVSTQVTSFAAELPDYKDNIKDKVADLRDMMRGGAIEKVQETLDDVKKELKRDETEEQAEAQDEAPDAADSSELPAEEPVPVRLAPEDYLLPDTSSLTPLLGVLATAGLVFVLVIFMLIYREDVLSRLVSLAGPQSLAVTTKALDEASRRISRYLLMQFLVNASFGLSVGAGLFLIGLPYSVLWGLCAFVFRYIPYVGPWIAALLPILVSLVHFPGWTTVLLVVGLFVALELFSNNVMEPWLYGHSVGLSPVAVIVAAVFWTWMWGPIGLVLATPLTVCLVVLGEHMPGLAIFDRLLSDHPALQAHLWLYQRLLAGDEEDAEEIVEGHLREYSPEATCDELLLPAILVARREQAGRRIDDVDLQQVERILGEIIDDLPNWRAAERPGEARASDGQPGAPVVAIGFPLQEADVLVLKLLQRLLDPETCSLEILSADTLIAERIARIEERQPAVVCLSSLPPGGLTHVRALCRSLRSRDPDAKILVGRWTGKGLDDKSGEQGQQPFKESGADATAFSLARMQELLAPIIQFQLAAAAHGPHLRKTATARDHKLVST